MENLSNTNSENTDLVEMIKPTALVHVPMSSGFYKRIQDVLTFLISSKTTEELNNAHKQIQENTASEDWVMHYETLLILAKEFEHLAKENGFVEKVSVEEAAKMLDLQ